MWGVILGDIAGSSFEFSNHRSKYFELLRKDAYFTDDTVCTAAIADILQTLYPNDLTSDAISDKLRVWCCTYLNRGFGSMFYQWIVNGVNTPYNSSGNGSLMRIAPVALFSIKNNLDKRESLKLAHDLTYVTHNHEQSLIAAKVYTEILYDLMKNKEWSVDEKKKYIEQMISNNYPNDLCSIDEYRVNIEFDVTAKTSLLVACQSILESVSFEDTLYTAVSVGGDSDTYAAIAGAIAEVVFGIPDETKKQIKNYFNDYDQNILNIINNMYK